jgi:RHS repeat-associated protein
VSAPYTRDSYTGLDYADQRFYASTYGRFNTPDPYQASGGPSSPASWNRYSYTRGDPVNRRDPRGLRDCLACLDDGGGGGDDGGGGYCPPSEESCGPGTSPGQPVSQPGGGGGSGGNPGNNFASTQTDEKDAYNDLANLNCYTLLGFTSAAAAQSWFTNSIRFVDTPQGYLQVQNGAPANATPAPASTSTYGTVYINTDYNWADFSKVTTSTGGTYNYLAYANRVFGTNMSSEQLGTLIIIHELQHNRPGGPDLESTAEKLAIYKDCIK